MTISGSSPTSLLESNLKADETRQRISVETLKKAQDVMKQQGEAMVQVLEAAGQPHARHELDAYA